MESGGIERLGFSDLTVDEGLLIVLYRDWLGRGPTRAIAEHSIARQLRGNRFREALDDIFVVFTEASRDDSGARDTGLVLSASEEDLLTRVSFRFEERASLRTGPPLIHIRPASDIFRSGHDRLMGAIDRSYWLAAALQASG